MDCLRNCGALVLAMAASLLIGGSHAQTDSGVSSFIDGVSKLIEFFKKLDGAIEQQTSIEMRQSLARELLKVNDSLLVLESNKQLLNEGVTDPDMDYARVVRRVEAIENEVRQLKASIVRVKQFAMVDDKTLDTQVLQQQLTSGLDAKLGSLKQIEAALTNKTADPSAPVNREALVREGEEAVKQVQEARRLVSAAVKRLRQNP